ncbi:hypothetical protein CGRA01v4_05904 [Colletotrichum graminicola]|nr:hypothetical protein CGRA01v4_05904 [Colletotrichum graminicola]
MLTKHAQTVIRHTDPVAKMAATIVTTSPGRHVLKRHQAR